MFKTKDVPALVQALKFAVDGEDVLASMTLFMTPIKQPLAHEVHPDLADALFKRRAGDYIPRKVVPNMKFDLEVNPQSMSYATHRDIEQGRGLIPHVKIDQLRAMRLFANSPDFTLAFDVHFPVNDQQLMWSLLNKLKKPLLLTFKKLQGDLDFPKQAQLCEICEQPATHRAKPSMSLSCAEHVSAFIGEEIEALNPDEEEATTADRVKKTIGKKKAAANGQGEEQLEIDTTQHENDEPKNGTGKKARKRSAGKKKKAAAKKGARRKK